MGRGWSGEAPPPVEVLHQVHRRHSVRTGQCGCGADGGGKNGTDTDSKIPGKLRSAHSSARQQAGLARSSRTARTRKTVGFDRAGTRRGPWGTPVARAARMRHHRRRPPRGSGGAVRDDTEKAETGERKEEKRKIKSGCSGIVLGIVDNLRFRTDVFYSVFNNFAEKETNSTWYKTKVSQFVTLVTKGD